MMLREQKMASLHKGHFFLWVLLSCLWEVSHPSPCLPALFTSSRAHLMLPSPVETLTVCTFPWHFGDERNNLQQLEMLL